MDLKSLIERAEKAAGSQKALALKIGLSESNIRASKAGVRGISNYACVRIAELIGEDEAAVIAASELVTEKKAERRAFWEKKLEVLAAGCAAFFVGVTLILTPTPSQAEGIFKVANLKCILCQI